jgi:hypothetical protein
VLGVDALLPPVPAEGEEVTDTAAQSARGLGVG